MNESMMIPMNVHVPHYFAKRQKTEA